MNPTIKDLQTSLHSTLSFDPLPRKIKITLKAATILDEVCKPVFVEMSRDEYLKTYSGTGTVGHWDAIPVEIDDTIENEYYELVYEEG